MARCRALCLAAGALLCACGTVWADDGFVQQIAANARSAWAEQREGSRWHRDLPAVGGLGFEVLAGGCPRLLMRSFLDVLNQHNGNREVYRIAGWCDLGEVRTTPATAQPKLVEQTWCLRKYRVGTGEAALEVYLSRLSPAVLFSSRAQKLSLFAGKKWLGQRLDTPQTETSIVPQYVAYAAADGVAVRETKAQVDLSQMREPWLLLWYGERAPFLRSAIPNIVWKMQPVKEFMRRGYFFPADLPVLLVLQHKGQTLRPIGDALELVFGERGAGAVAIVPVLGFFRPRASDTARWSKALPADIVTRCRAWARRLKRFPLACAESRRVFAGGDAVTIRQRFTYLDLPDDWGTESETLAPVPPVLALAARYGFPVELSGELAPQAIATHSGPYSGVAGAESVEFTIRGLRRYIGERVASDIPRHPEAQPLVRELRAEVEKMLDAGRLAPAICLAPKHLFRIRFHFANPGETVLAVAEALPYLEQAQRERAVQYALACMRWVDPLREHSVPNFVGARREYFALLPLDYMAQVLGKDALRLESSWVREVDRANNVYALWALAAASGRWEFIKQRWEEIKAVALAHANAVEWATCAYFRGEGEHRSFPSAIPGEDHGSVAAANGRFARWVALARIAERLGDSDTAQLATYLLARTMIFRFAQGKLVRYMYDEGFQTIDTSPDWMLRLTTASGNGGGQALLWADRWAGAEDDVRQVIRWDEFGPNISQMFGDHWYPVFPTFLDLTPECGRFLADYLLPETRAFVVAVERNCPAWFLTRRVANVGKEKFMDYPQNSYGLFLGKCYALGATGQEMLRFQDIPFTRVGDLYHMRKLVANLRCFGGLRWQPVGEES